MFTSDLLRVKVMINMPHRMLSSAGSIVAVPDTATIARVYTRRFDMRFGRIYRNRTGYCTTLYTMRYAMYNSLRHIQCAALYTMRYAMSNCPAPWSGPGLNILLADFKKPILMVLMLQSPPEIVLSVQW